MMQDYDFAADTNIQGTVNEAVQEPSQEVVQNILNFARCCQSFRIGDINIKVYLN
ncbi:MAG: hypothetical protein K6F85_06295 [Bacteroidales bacterium]|nr:hypothetical protein [Bacteroidales bacterium]